MPPDRLPASRPTSSRYADWTAVDVRVPVRDDQVVPICVVTDEAVELVLFEGEQELARATLVHTPGKRQTLKL